MWGDERDTIEILEAILNSDDAPEGSMNLSELDGFLAAIACGPVAVGESEWMPAVFGLTPLEFAAQSYDPVLIDAIGSYAAQIAHELSDPENSRYLPMLFAAPDGGHDGVDWSCGFMYAIGMRKKEWLPLMKSRQRDLLMPILAHEPDEFETGPPVLDDNEVALLRENALEALAFTVAGVNIFWRNRQRKTAGLPRLGIEDPRTVPKVGRNDPCPCGSGRKFKKCCLAATDPN